MVVEPLHGARKRVQHGFHNDCGSYVPGSCQGEASTAPGVWSQAPRECFPNRQNHIPCEAEEPSEPSLTANTVHQPTGVTVAAQKSSMPHLPPRSVISPPCPLPSTPADLTCLSS